MVALLDTDCDPDQIDPPIPGNDDKYAWSIEHGASARLSEVIIEGKAVAAPEAPSSAREYGGGRGDRTGIATAVGCRGQGRGEGRGEGLRGPMKATPNHPLLLGLAGRRARGTQRPLGHRAGGTWPTSPPRWPKGGRA